MFGDGDCLVQPGDGVLDLRVSAPSQLDVDRLAQVVGSHLERFGQRNELQVSWSAS